MRVSIRSSGPETAAAATSGLTATQRTLRAARPRGSASTARIGPMDRYGLLGARTIASASRAPRARRRPARLGGAVVVDRVDVVGVAAPDEPLLETKRPAGVTTCVRKRSSVAGTIVVARPTRSVSRRSRRERTPLRSACVRTRWRPRSRSPSRNQSSPPQLAADSRAFHVSSALPQPRSVSMSPASV